MTTFQSEVQFVHIVTGHTLKYLHAGFSTTAIFTTHFTNNFCWQYLNTTSLVYFIRDLCVHVRIRAAEALGCNTLQANKSTVAKLCNQSILPVPTDSAETLQVKKCNSFGAVTFCYASMFGFCGAVAVVYVDRKSADFVVSRSRWKPKVSSPTHLVHVIMRAPWS